LGRLAQLKVRRRFAIVLRAAEFYKRAAYDAQNDRFTSSMALKKRTGKYESRFRELVLGVMD
jgi:hypothetical protein